MDIRTLPTHPGTGLTAIGLLPDGRPIWPIAGAAEDPPSGDTDGDAGEGDEDPEGDSEGDEDPEEPEAWKAPSKEEWEAAQAKLKRANDQAKRLREQMKAAGVTTGPTKAAPAKAPPAKKAAAPAAKDEAEEPAEPAVDTGELERWQVRALKADAKAELIARGCDPKMVSLALGQLNGADIDWDGDSPILDEWLDQMEDDYPALFAKPAAPTKAMPRKAGSIDQGAGANGAPTEAKRPYGEAVLRRGGWGQERRAGLPGRRN